MLAKAGSADPGGHDMRYVVLIMDGAAGWPLAELGGRTCLATADTPNLDWIASRGTVGTAATVPAGMEPSSAAACMSIIGYDPRSYQMGRGAIEAASLDIEMGPDDVAFRCNLVTVIDGIMADYSAGHIPSSQSHEIVRRLKAVLDSDEVTLYPGLSYRHILKVSGHPDWADAVCTPPHDIHGKPVGDHTPKGPGAEALSMLMSESVEALAHDPLNRERLASGASPATTIWPFWPGKPPAHAPRFDELRQVRAALTSPVDLLNGLARIFSIDRLAIHGVTDGDDNDYAGQIEGALAALDDHDLVFVHVESPDEAAHAGDVSRKIAAIERIDRDMVLRLIEHSSRCPLRVLVLPDHPTPIELRTHIGEPVPFVAFGPGIAAGGSTGLDELTAAGSGLRFEATELLDRLIRADFA